MPEHIPRDLTKLNYSHPRKPHYDTAKHNIVTCVAKVQLAIVDDDFEPILSTSDAQLVLTKTEVC